MQHMNTRALLAVLAVTAAAASAAQGAEPGTLDEVVVTANKRAEPLREVASSVTAFTGENLDALGAQSFADYIGRAPGVNFQASTPGVSNVTVRGVGTATVFPDQGQATTGIYLNDIPLTDPGFAMAIPDLDAFDMQRVEVLRGPQGTLFGAAALGGAVNYIINPVSLTETEVHVQAGIAKTQNSSDPSYAAKAAVNIPLIDNVLGVRVTAIKHYDAGYLDNITVGRKDSNDRRVEDFRANVLWKVNDALNLSFFSFYDRARSGDGFYAFPQLGEFKRATIVLENAEFITRINSFKLDANLGFATFSVAAADSHKQQNSISDLTPYYNDVPTIGPSLARTHGDMLEARLTSPSHQNFEWLVGAYYGRFNESYPTPTLQGGVDVYDFTVGYVSNEIAGFGEATYRFTDQWRATVGGRYYNNRLTTDTIQGTPGTPYDTVIGAQRGTGFSPKASITFEPSKELMVYGLVSKGFRMGGVNLNTPIASFPTPATYGSDSLINYEVGVRTAWLNHTLTWDTTFFYINWSNIQLRLARPDGRSYVANAGDAHSRGIENALSWRPTEHFSLIGSLTYLDAALAANLALGDGTVLRDGATLPGASKWTSAETATYTFASRFAPFVSLSHRFVSRAQSDFSDTLPIDNYHLLDIRAGAKLGSVTAMLYLDNVADRRGVTAAQTFGNFLNDFYVRPRTVGLQVDWRLGR